MKDSHRPSSFKDFVGQEKTKHTLKVMIDSSKIQKKQMDHVLLYGAPGLGKTTLASIISNELGTNIRFAQGPLLDKKSDILSLLSSIKNGDVIFVDEIHGINKNIEELLYSALEDRVIDVNVGPDSNSKMIRMKLPSFTFVGATTKVSKISKPLKDRFGLLVALKKYSKEDIIQIVKNTCKRINLDLPSELFELIEEYSSGVPRKVISHLNRIKDFVVVDEPEKIGEKYVRNIFEMMGLYRNGLNDSHIRYLEVLSDSFYEKSVSIDNLALMLNEERYNIEKDVEPLLLLNGFIQISSRGRKATTKGLNYLLTYKLS